MRLATAKKKYRNQWIAFQYTNKEKREGKVLFHTKYKEAVFDILNKRKKKPKKLYITYSGPIVPRGTAVMIGPMI